jgi:GT2 family glycosyltransferase
MKASVIVLNYNAGGTLEGCIESLLELDYPDYEVILVDNGSSDGSAQAIEKRFGRSDRLRIVWSRTNEGCAGGRNIGMRNARGDIFCFVDSDAFADPAWLSHVVAAFSPGNVGIVGSRLILAQNRLLLNGLGGAVNAQGYGVDIGFGEPVEYTRLPGRTFFASGNGLCVRRDVIERIGELDEVYFNYYEDVELCMRARRAGFEVALAEKATLYHLFAGGSSALHPKRMWLCERNRIRTVLRHFPLGRILRWIPREIEHERRCRGLAEYQPGTFSRAWWWNLAKLPAIVRFRLFSGLPPLDFGGTILPHWGHTHFKGYNLSLRPDEKRWSSEVRPGKDDEGRLLYGWHGPEENPEGMTYRWTDDLAALGLRVAGGGARSFELRYFWATEPVCTFVYVHHLESSRTFEWRLPVAPPLAWTRLQCPLDVPPGRVQVILQTPKPYREAAARGRALGVAVGECRVS